MLLLINEDYSSCLEVHRQMLVDRMVLIIVADRLTMNKDFDLLELLEMRGLNALLVNSVEAENLSRKVSTNGP